MAKDDNIRVVARNKKAKHDYHIEETYEAGIKLKGTEIKSVRQGKVNLKDSYAIVKSGEIFILNMHISPYKQGNRYNHKPDRTRKLLLHKREIDSLYGKTQREGFTLVPIAVYLKDNLAKIELALAKGKNVRDKRREIKKKTAQREMKKAFKDHIKGRT
ncbi:MAG TPA: SsrA-binding protein SmpB [Halanaerobiales bacterium]|nr:SsrA-binding protein SmpB [Halanaerobiales bacterium]